MKKKRLGEIGENLAVKYLKKRGYKIIDRNFATRFGEIDIIAKKRGLLVFVEVKTRKSRFGQPEWGISKQKISQVQKMAQIYLVTCQPRYQNLRIDAVCIQLNNALQPADIRYYDNIKMQLLD